MRSTLYLVVFCFSFVAGTGSTLQKKLNEIKSLQDLAQHREQQQDVGFHEPWVDYVTRLRGCDDTISVQAGRLEIFYKDRWGTVCDDGFTDSDAHVACYNLGFDRNQGIRLRGSFGPGTGDIVLTEVGCFGNETALNACRHRNWLDANCTHEQDVSLACLDSAGLIVNSGPATRVWNDVDDDENAGRLEIFHNNCWGTVCSDNFDDIDATVACRSINRKYRVGRKVVPADEVVYGPGEGMIWIDELDCHSNDVNIGYCAHNPWGVHDCHHDEDVAIICEVGPCDSGPCKNGATCTDIDETTVSCQCAEGYSGDFCDLDRCSNTPCQNGATCNAFHDPLCECPEWLTGETCDSSIGGCDNSPCLNGATCVANDTLYTCECVWGYTGRLCETVINGCDDDPCMNGGSCDNLESDPRNFTCFCPFPYTGKTCIDIIGGCDQNRCQNGATCIDSGMGGFQCKCPIGYHGSFCEGVRPKSPCGNILMLVPIEDLPEIPPPIPADTDQPWTAMCVLGNTDDHRPFWNTPCVQLLQNVYGEDGDGVGIILDGGNFGCWTYNIYPFESLYYMACKDNYNQTKAVTSEPDSVMMAICIRYNPDVIPIPDKMKNKRLPGSLSNK